MAVRIRLTRMGARSKPVYRIVASDSRRPRDGQYIELIGTYNPALDDVKVNEEVALKWLSRGAIPSDTVKNLFKEAGIMKKFADAKVKTTKKETKKEAKEETKETKKKPVAKKTTTKKASK